MERSDDRQTLLALTQTVERVTDLFELFLKDWRKTVNALGKDIDEVPTIVRLDLKRLEDQIAEMQALVQPKVWLNILHNMLSKTRLDAWMQKQSDGLETEAQHAIRRYNDFLRDSIRAELHLQPEALIDPAPVSGAIVVGTKRKEDDTGVHFVYDGKPVMRVSAKKLRKWGKRIAIGLTPVATALATYLWQRFHGG